MRHLQLILLLAPHLMLVWPGLTLLAAGLGLGVLSVLSPAGIGLGSLQWQPIFFGPILIVLGALAAVSGTVVANHSPLLSTEVSSQFAFAGHPRFAKRCLVGGAVLLLIGLGIDAALFVVWLTSDTSPAQALSLAGIAQALIITGAGLAGFGFMQRVLSLRDDYAQHVGDIDIAELGSAFLNGR